MGKPRSLAITAESRAHRIASLCQALQDLSEHALNLRITAHDHELLDRVDCDLERCAVWLWRIAENVRAIPVQQPTATPSPSGGKGEPTP